MLFQDCLTITDASVTRQTLTYSTNEIVSQG